MNEKYSKRIMKVERYSDRLMAIQLVVEEEVWNVFSAYAPQVGRPNEEKKEFWERLDEIMSQIPQDQGLIIGGDLNAHLGKENAEFKEEHGQMGYGITNMDGRRVLEIIQALDINAVNTTFKKKDEHLITFKSGNHASQIDYILVRKECQKEGQELQGIPVGGCNPSTQATGGDFETKKEKKWRPRHTPQKIKIWKLKDHAKEFNNKIKELRTNESNPQNSVAGKWIKMQNILETAAEKVCGKTSGRKPREMETWWWNEEVQRCLGEKAYKRLKDGGNHQAYKNKKKEAKRAVAKARGEAWREWCDNLETKQGEENIFRIARTRAKQKTLCIQQ